MQKETRTTALELELLIKKCVHKAKFVNERMSYLIFLDQWSNFTTANVRVPEKAEDDAKESFYEELECMFDQFCRFNMKILLQNFNAKVRWEETFIATIQNECTCVITVYRMGLLEINNGIGCN
jgi:hypothetical protein